MKNLRISFIAFFLIIISGNGFCEDKPRIVVFDMDSKSKEISRDEVLTLSDYIRSSFINTGVFEVISREQLNKIMEEYKFQTAGLTEESNVVRLGKILNVNNAVMGTIGKFGDTYIINIKMLNMESGKYLSAVSIKAENKNECLTSIEEKVNMIAQNMQNNNGDTTGQENNSKKPFEEKLKSKQNRLLTLCPDGNFESGKILVIDGYSSYRSDLERKWHLNMFTLSSRHAVDGHAAVENGECHVKLNTKGEENWYAQLCMLPIKIENGKNYRVTFAARSSSVHNIGTSISKVGSNWTAYGGNNYNIGTDMKTYSYKFKMTYPTDERARLNFDLANSAGDIWISNVRVEEVSD